MDFPPGLALSQVSYLSCICFLTSRFLLVLCPLAFCPLLPSPSPTSHSFSSFSFLLLLLSDLMKKESLKKRFHGEEERSMCLSPPDTSITERHFCLGLVTSFFLGLLVIVIAFCLFILFTWFLQQEYWSGLSLPPSVDHVLSELFIMTPLSWVALHGMAHSFTELHKHLHHDEAVIHEGVDQTWDDSGGQRSLVCCSTWSRTELDTT